MKSFHKSILIYIYVLDIVDFFITIVQTILTFIKFPVFLYQQKFQQLPTLTINLMF